MTVDVNGKKRNAFDSYALLSHKKIEQHARTYVGTHTRLAQDTSCLANCIVDLLTGVALTEITKKSK